MECLPLETCQSEGVSDNVSSEKASSNVSIQTDSKQVRFTLSCTAKLRAARDVVGPSGKQVILRSTLAYGIKYGIGEFCLLDTREQQVGWVPENDKSPLDVVGKASTSTSTLKCVGKSR